MYFSFFLATKGQRFILVLGYLWIVHSFTSPSLTVLNELGSIFAVPKTSLHYLCVNRVSRKHQMPLSSQLSTPPLEICSPSRPRSSLNGWPYTALLGMLAVFSRPRLLCSPPKHRSKIKHTVSLIKHQLRRSQNMRKKENEKNGGLLTSQRMGPWSRLLLQPFSFLFFVVWGCCWMWCWKSWDEERALSWM